MYQKTHEYQVPQPEQLMHLKSEWEIIEAQIATRIGLRRLCLMCADHAACMVC